jgi:hypothetical protein
MKTEMSFYLTNINHHIDARVVVIAIRLLVGRLRPPKFGHTQHGHGETRCAHRSEFLCSARDLGVGDAAEYGAGGIGVVRIRKSLSSPRILPVLGDGG